MEFDISGNYPLILAGESAGEIQVSREGLYWNFEASCKKQEELVRLSVYGGGKEGYLGLMEPAGERLRLSRKLSRTAMRDFPKTISHGGQRGEPLLPTEGEETLAEEIPPPEEEQEPKPDESDSYNGEFPLSYYNKANVKGMTPHNENKPPALVEITPLSEPAFQYDNLSWGPCALPCSLFSGLKEKKLCGNISGAYLAREGEMLFLAAPEVDILDFPKTPAMDFEDEIMIAGEKYKICKIKRNRCDSGF